MALYPYSHIGCMGGLCLGEPVFRSLFEDCPYRHAGTTVKPVDKARWLMNVRDPSSRLVRWNLLLQEYSFDIVHRPGKRNRNADALSRVGVAGVVDFTPSSDEAHFREEQGRNQALQQVIQQCKNSTTNTYKKADTIAKAFVEGVVLRYGAPLQLLTDQGTNFTGKLMREVCDVLAVKRLRTTAYHPQCNGAVECLNQILIMIMSHYMSEAQRDWDKWLPFATFAYNTAFHECTKDSPYYLLFGRDPVVPGVAFCEPKGHYGTLDDYRAELTQRLQRAHNMASSTLRSAAELRKKRLGPSRRDPKFKVGERVYIRIGAVVRGLARKLAAKWVGPYRIIERLLSVTMRVRNIKTRESKVIHPNRLRRADPSGRAELEQSSRPESSTRSFGSLAVGAGNANMPNIPPELLLELIR
ncbi:uncharacterized protein LOC142765319 [Rhipicephalus microplus]|uniref:uncharacterized protein LOC142765319 n=1 Tax=Rhipicephalus microplus TaxID=6941 RepID=UPI003F6A6AB3